MAKRPADDEASDMEAGMTTAERRRRRRRGGGIRVPSDNVPRTRAPTAPPPPRPEDPALAMSIAYSFTNDASGPVPRQAEGRDSNPTLADPQSNGESSDFETKTREMSAVDLEALGLNDPSTSGNAIPRAVSSPGMPLPVVGGAPSNDVDVDVDVEAGDTIDQQEIPDSYRRAARQSDVHAVVAVDPDLAAAAALKKSLESRRLQTVTLSEDDLEEVRASTAPVAPMRAKPASSPPPIKPTTKPPPLSPARTSSGEITRAAAATPPHPTPIAQTESSKTQQLQAVDIEVIAQATPAESMSAPEIDLSELAIRAESSGEIEVDVDDASETARPPAPPKSEVKVEPEAQLPKLPRAQTSPPTPPPAAPATPPPAPTQASKPAVDTHAPPPPPPPVAKLPPPAPTLKKPSVDKAAEKSAPGYENDHRGKMTCRHLAAPLRFLPGPHHFVFWVQPFQGCLRSVIQIDSRLSETKFYPLGIRPVEYLTCPLFTLHHAIAILS